MNEESNVNIFYFYCRNQADGQLKIDDTNPVTGASDKSANKLDTDGEIWIGMEQQPILLFVMERHLKESCFTLQRKTNISHNKNN